MTELETVMHIERRSVTWPQLIGWGGLAVTQIFLAGVMWATLTSDMRELQEDLAASKADLSTVKSQMEPLPLALHRITQNEATNVQQNQRIDLIVNSLGIKIDGATASINQLRTDVQVLTERVDSALELPQRSNLKRRPTNVR